MESHLLPSSPAKGLGARQSPGPQVEKMEKDALHSMQRRELMPHGGQKEPHQSQEENGKRRSVHSDRVEIPQLKPSPYKKQEMSDNGGNRQSPKQSPFETIVLSLGLAKTLGIKDRKDLKLSLCQLPSESVKPSHVSRTKVRDSREGRPLSETIPPLLSSPNMMKRLQLRDNGHRKDFSEQTLEKAVVTPSPSSKSGTFSSLTRSGMHNSRFRSGTAPRHSLKLPIGTQRHQRHINRGSWPAGKYGIRVIEENGQFVRELPLVIYRQTMNLSDRLLVRHSRGRRPNDVDLVFVQSIANQQLDEWRVLFDQLDRYRTGQIPVLDFRRLLRDPRFCPNMDRHTLEVLEMRCTCNEAGKRTITYQEFINIMSNKRNPSFRLAVESQGKEDFLSQDIHPGSLFSKMVRRIAKSYLTDEVDRQYYADRYTCCPPPLFVPVITLVEVGFFIYHCLEAGEISPNGPVPVKSFLIYRPDKRIEMWRFVFYMFIHAGWVHLFFNMLIQIVLGIPLEMVHGSCRILLVYMAGVLAGSLGTSIFDINAYLVGASGGVYALLAAHLANILLNYSNMELGILKLAAVLIIASADVGFAVWDRYSEEDKAPPVGYTSHLMGSLAGLTIGLVVLKNFEQKLHEQYLWWIALAIYLGCTVFAIFWNVFYY